MNPIICSFCGTAIKSGSVRKGNLFFHALAEPPQSQSCWEMSKDGTLVAFFSIEDVARFIFAPPS